MRACVHVRARVCLSTRYAVELDRGRQTSTNITISDWGRAAKNAAQCTPDPAPPVNPKAESSNPPVRRGVYAGVVARQAGDGGAFPVLQAHTHAPPSQVQVSAGRKQRCSRSEGVWDDWGRDVWHHAWEHEPGVPRFNHNC